MVPLISCACVSVCVCERERASERAVRSCVSRRQSSLYVTNGEKYTKAQSRVKILYLHYIAVNTKQGAKSLRCSKFLKA